MAMAHGKSKVSRVVLFSRVSVGMTRNSFHDPFMGFLGVLLHHVVKPNHLAAHDCSEASLMDFSCQVGVGPAGMVSRYVDARVFLVPGREFVIDVRLDGPQVASHKVDNSRNLVFAVCRQFRSAGIAYKLGIASLTSVYQENLDPKVCIADAEQDNFVGFVKLEKVIPEIAN